MNILQMDDELRGGKATLISSWEIEIPLVIKQF